MKINSYFRDSSLIDFLKLYKQGDTIRFKYNNGQVLNYVAQNLYNDMRDQSGSNAENLCGPDIQITPYYSKELVSIDSNYSNILLSAFVKNFSRITENLGVRYKNRTYESEIYFPKYLDSTINGYKEIIINGTTYKSLEISYDYYRTSRIYLNNINGLIKMSFSIGDTLELYK